MESFDVVIIGAGPAGLKCAETLGNSNKKVLLLEKNSKIGPKPCGGLMTQIGIKNNPEHRKQRTEKLALKRRK